LVRLALSAVRLVRLALSAVRLVRLALSAVRLVRLALSAVRLVLSAGAAGSRCWPGGFDHVGGRADLCESARAVWPALQR
ncbi:hypothetical protein AB0C07_04740, partial [Actinoplanes missouriensis]|uniref:hypothetical protein n=1 Tax=Actinoplanes missouriensis TaxID=1866 RepID=UPI0033BFFCF8